MTHAQARLSILNYRPPAIDVSDLRKDRLAAAIKAETRWLLITARPRSFAIDVSHYTNDRKSFAATWPRIRNRCVPAEEMRGFYQYVADQASILVNLIEMRGQRNKTAGAEGGNNDSG